MLLKFDYHMKLHYSQTSADQIQQPEGFDYHINYTTLKPQFSSHATTSHVVFSYGINV